VGDIKKVQLLLDHGADVNARSQMGRTPLLVAAYTNGASEIVKLLLDKSADINTADTTGITPLVAATNVNDAVTARLLIEEGAKVDARANIGQAATPLMGASHNGNLEIVQLLLRQQAPVNVTSSPVGGAAKNGPIQLGSVTALHLGALGGNPDVVKALLEAGARVDLQDVRGMPPLMWSVSTDRPNVPIVRMLFGQVEGEREHRRLGAEVQESCRTRRAETQTG
jgi:ankyrin repeat protein